MNTNLVGRTVSAEDKEDLELLNGLLDEVSEVVTRFHERGDFHLIMMTRSDTAADTPLRGRLHEDHCRVTLIPSSRR